MKLIPELVPGSLWGVSASRLLPRRDWERIRAQVLQEQGGTCSFCGYSQEKGMICHEIWAYDDEAGSATLTALTIICGRCNLVEHAGLASVRGLADQALQHLAEVNGIDLEQARALIKESFTLWSHRSQQAWSVTVAPALLERYPPLAALVGERGEPGHPRLPSSKLRGRAR